ncbi:MAG: phosphoenolpyruvate hydrolase family protein [Candidatus Humimicrobiaceae bacterium]
MAKIYSRQEFLKLLRDEIKRGKPIVMTGAGNGIAAKFIEKGGVDIIGVYNTGYFRMQGYGSLAGMLPMADANDMVYQMGRREVLPQVKEVPVIAGLNGVDVLRNMGLFLEDCRRIGFSGVHNFPTVAWFEGEFRNTLEKTGLGYSHEIEMLKMAKDLDMVSIGYAFNEEDTERLIEEASPDIFIFHAGITRGGSTGYQDGSSLEEMAERSQKHFRIAKSIKEDLIILVHGAALVNPEDGKYIVDNTDCHGIQLGSSIERMAIEKPLEERALSFKEALSFPEGEGRYKQ